MNIEDEIKMFETFDELDAKCKELTGGKFTLEDLVDEVRMYEHHAMDASGGSYTSTRIKNYYDDFYGVQCTWNETFGLQKKKIQLTVNYRGNLDY